MAPQNHPYPSSRAARPLSSRRARGVEAPPGWLGVLLLLVSVALPLFSAQPAGATQNMSDPTVVATSVESTTTTTTFAARAVSLSFGGGFDAGLFDGGTTPPPPDPDPPPVLRGLDQGFDWLELELKTQPATSNLLFTSRSVGGPWTYRQTLPPGARTEIRDENLERGGKYCYQIRATGTGEETRTSLCLWTDTRVGFESGEMSPEASARVLSAFSWAETEPVEQGDAEQPALYAMAALGTDDGFVTTVRDLGIHVQDHPLFPDEFPVWDSANTIVLQGEETPLRWRFVVIPGVLYNAIRERNIEREQAGEDTGTLVFREIHEAGARFHPYGAHRLDWTYLRDRYFEYNGRVFAESCLLDETTAMDPECQFFLTGLIRDVVAGLVDGIEGLVNGIRRIAGFFDRKLGEEVMLTVDFELEHAETGFLESMRSGWSGDPLTLEGVTVQVRQGFSMFTASIDENGRIQRLVADSPSSFCLELENDAAVITEFLTEKTICLAGKYVMSPGVHLELTVQHPYASALAGITDARRYMREVMGVEVDQAVVLVGSMAELLSVDDLPYAPCQGIIPLVHLDVLPFVNVAKLALAGIDIVLPPSETASRGVPVHEYGHVVMCQLLSDQGFLFATDVWYNVILGVFDKSSDNERWVVNEAFADFISAQVLGATNYFRTPGSTMRSGMHYAESGGAGLEHDFRSPAPGGELSEAVAHVASILHDVFDGHGDAPEPNDGTHWHGENGVLSWDGALEDSDRADEPVAVRGFAMRDLMQFVDEQGASLNLAPFLGALEQLALSEGATPREICDAFALHYDSGDCPNYSGMDVPVPSVQPTTSAGPATEPVEMQPTSGSFGSLLSGSSVPYFSWP